MTSGGFRPDGTVIGFPQPTRPDNSYSPRLEMIPSETPYPASEYFGEDSVPSPVTAYPVGYPVQSRDGNEFMGRRDREVGGGEKESIEELKRGIMELYNKLPMAVRSQVNLEKFHIPNNIVTNLKVDAAQSREVQGIVDQLSPKLERFKVRTVQAGGGGVVKVEDDKRGR